MKKTILTYGLITGILCSIWMLINVGFCGDMDMSIGMMIGYTTMILSHILVFIGVKRFRDRMNNGTISFGKAFLTGFGISFIAATMYVVAWLIDYQYFASDFMDVYAAKSIEEMKSSGMPPEQLKASIGEMNYWTKLYKENVLVRIGMTYSEIIPVSILMSLIAAFVYRKKAAV